MESCRMQNNKNITKIEEEILTMKEAAELISIAVGTLYNWRSNGLLLKNKRYKKGYILEVREKWITGKLEV